MTTPCVYLSPPFPLQHMYAPDDISSVYGRRGTRLSPTLAAFVNGVAVSINRWNRWVSTDPSTPHNSDTLNPLPQPNYGYFILSYGTVWAANHRRGDENTELTPYYPSADISNIMSANIAWHPFLKKPSGCQAHFCSLHLPPVVETSYSN